MTELVDATPYGISRAARAVERGRLVAFPTDTVYGVACLAESEVARRRFYAAKQRDPKEPAIVMVASAPAAAEWVVVDARAAAMMAKHWPGPLTLVLPATVEAIERLGMVVLNGTLAVRIPDHEAARDLLHAVGKPLATSSANVAGAPAPATGAEAAAALGQALELVIDGECPLGVASSILDLTGGEPRVVREGAIPAERLLS